MPHKQNPVICNAIIANAARIPHLATTLLMTMSQQHERSPGLWHAEWEVIESIFKLTAGSLEKYLDLLITMEVKTDRMASNLDITQGLIYSENIAHHLAGRMGKKEAHNYVKEICEKAKTENRHLRDLLNEANFSPPEIDSLFDPEKTLGSTYQIIEAILKKTKN
jgi:3-carboxy-cis,cis-muconate cycloisomerase